MHEAHSVKIRNIIFDLGGVLLNINPLLSLLEFARICNTDPEILQSRLAADSIFQKYDTGKFTDSQFRNELCRIMNYNAADEEIDAAWNILLLDFPPARVNMLKQLRRNYRIFLLSNTNGIHFRKYTHDFSKKYGISMTSLFDKLYLSYEIGIHKPDEGIYKHVLQDAGLNAGECLFIDDSLPNIEAAERMGMQCIHISNGTDVTSYFENGILKF